MNVAVWEMYMAGAAGLKSWEAAHPRLSEPEKEPGAQSAAPSARMCIDGIQFVCVLFT
ncbi:hypothetical protein FB451DRAFT_1419798 [Mycena latifolia]|nr:hypothetical protein FB451DRAFT_1419798 [Mycena latifolia]